MFQKQIKEVQYIIPIRHITNISDFVWFQRSCGSMKSVSSFSSIDISFGFHKMCFSGFLDLLLDEQNNLYNQSYNISALASQVLYVYID